MVEAHHHSLSLERWNGIKLRSDCVQFFAQTIVLSGERVDRDLVDLCDIGELSLTAIW